MVFRTPDLDETNTRVLALIDELRDGLRDRVAQPRRWSGGLRRVTFARAVQASNSIEGYNATLEDAVAAVDGDELIDASTETALAVAGYRDAMTYVLQLSQDETAVVDETLLKALHFMMVKHDLSKYPGRWRPGTIFVRREPSGEIVYEGPPSDQVADLMREMLVELESSNAPVLVKAAMAHLNLVMVHPFKDGNGRMARCLQTLVLAKEQVTAPVFSSIEEYLGRNTQAYYDILAEVGAGAWHPENSAEPWIRFCMTAHYRQAKTLTRRIHEYERLWIDISELARSKHVPERAVGGLMDAALGLRVRNSSYRSAVEISAGEEISELTATRDLGTLVRYGLLEPVGERRGRHYRAAAEVTAVWDAIRNERPPRFEDDPFEVIRVNDELDANQEQLF